MKFPGLIGCSLAAKVILFAGSLSAAEELRYFHLLSGDAAGSGFEMAAATAAAISGPPGAPPCSADSRCGVPGLIGVAQSSPGPVASLSLLSDGLADAALVRASLLHFVRVQSSGDSQSLTALRHVSNIGTHELHIFVAAELKITKIEQLRHYRIAIGSPLSEAPTVARALFSHAGLPPDKMQLKQAADVDAADMIVNGDIDAFVYIGNAKTRFVAELLNKQIVSDLLLDDELLDALVRSVVGTYKITVPITAPSTGQADAWVQRLAFPVSLVVNRQTGPRLVEAVLRSVWWKGNEDLLHQGGVGPLGHTQAFEAAQLPLHQGAALYFEHNGGLPRGVNPGP